MDNELDKKINDYLDERLIYYIGFTELTDEVIDSIIIDEDYDSIVSFLKLMLHIEKENINKFPQSVFKNFVKFVNTDKIRFNKAYKNKEVYDIINEMITLSNTAEFDDFTFFENEATKFFEDYEGCLKEDYVLILEVERVIHDFVEDAIYANDDQFREKYLEELFINDRNSNPFYNLFIINYILNDFPLLFENKAFKNRVSLILKEYNLKSTKNQMIQHLSKEKTLKKKFFCYQSYKFLHKKNNAVIHNIENEFKRS